MVYIISALILYTIAILLGTVAARKADTNLVTAIVNAISTIIPLIVVATYMKKDMFVKSKEGLIYAVLGGIAIAFFTMAMNKSFATNKVAIVSPVVFGGAIFLSSVLSYFLFKEKITPMQGIGLVVVLIGFLVIILAKLSGR